MGNKITKPRILRRRQNSNPNNHPNFPVEENRENTINEETIYDADFSWLNDRRVSDELNDAIYFIGRYTEETESITHLMHVIFKYILKGNNRIPITPEIKSCLHIGAGHYVWLIEMANQHRETLFEGFDITVATENNSTPLPSNVNLCNGNIFSGGLPYPDEMFDYVNVRSFLSWLPGDKIPFVLNEIKRVTKKGGWIELLEMDPFIKNGTSYYEENLGRIWKEICRHQGYNPSTIINLDKLFSRKEFSDIKNSKISIPIGKYGGKVGELYAKQFINGSNAVASVIMNNLDMTNEEIQSYLQECVKEFNFKQSYSNTYLISAKKI